MFHIRKCSAAAAVILPLFLAFPAYGAETAAARVDVNARYSGNFDGIDTVVLGRDHSIVLTGGQTLTIGKMAAADQGLRLVATPVLGAEAEAYGWVAEELSFKGRNPYGYHLAFYRGNASAAPKGEVYFSLTVPSGYEAESFCYLDGSGNTSPVRSVKNGGSISFTASRGGYYVFLKASAEEKRDEDSGTGDQAAGTVTTDAKKGYVNSVTGIIPGPTGGTKAGYSNWQLDQKGWRFRYADGTYAGVKNQPEGAGKGEADLSWELVNGSWFVFGTDGYARFGWVHDPAVNRWYYLDVNMGMRTGWHQEEQDGYWYYFNPDSGTMSTGWHKIDGSWYYFALPPQEATWEYDGTDGVWKYKGKGPGRPTGSMYRNEKTPDGYEVDGTGRWRP